MPTYEYLCKTCGLRFDTVQSFADDAYTACDQAPITCPRGGGGELRKVFGAVGITFKGSGFYKNDSRGSTPATPSTTESPAAPKTDAAPAAAAATPAASSGSSDSGGKSHSHSHGPATHTH